MKKTFILSTLLTTSILMSSLTSFAANDNTNVQSASCQNAAKQEQYQGPDRRMQPPCPKCMCEKHKQKMKEMHEARKKEFESRLNLTDEQKQKAKEIRMKGHQEIKPIFEEMKTKKSELIELKKKGNPSLIEQAKIRQLENEVKALKDKAKSIRQSNKNEFEKILTKKQKNELKKMEKEGEERFKEMQKNHKGPHHPPICPLDKNDK